MSDKTTSDYARQYKLGWTWEDVDRHRHEFWPHGDPYQLTVIDGGTGRLREQRACTRAQAIALELYHRREIEEDLAARDEWDRAQARAAPLATAPVAISTAADPNQVDMLADTTVVS